MLFVKQSFNCNLKAVDKGRYLSDEEIEFFGETLLKGLHAEGCLEIHPDPVEPEVPELGAGEGNEDAAGAPAEDAESGAGTPEGSGEEAPPADEKPAKRRGKKQG